MKFYGYTTKELVLGFVVAVLVGAPIGLAIGTYHNSAGFVNNPAATNVTYDKLVEFLAADNTHNHTYQLWFFDCAAFSRTLHNNAEAAGIMAGGVTIRMWPPPSHAVVAFNTTDRGLVYVETAGGADGIGWPIVGRSYCWQWLSDYNGTPPQWTDEGSKIYSISVAW